MDALKTLIIRHAEKPLKARPGPGLTITGTQDATRLTLLAASRQAIARRDCQEPKAVSGAATHLTAGNVPMPGKFRQPIPAPTSFRFYL